MSRALLSRIERLEARKAKQGPREIGIIVERFPRRWQERDGILHELPRFRPGEYELMAREQQNRLLAELAEFAEQLNEGDDNDTQAESPPIVGNDCRAPLKPGQRSPRFIFETDKAGNEWQTALLHKSCEGFIS